MGDFNIIRNDSERHGGRPKSLIAMQDFNDGIDACSVLDANFPSNRFSCCNGHGGQARSWARLDRTLCMSSALIFWLDALVKYLPRTTSDHASMVLQIVSHSYMVFIPLNSNRCGLNMSHFLC